LSYWSISQDWKTISLGRFDHAYRVARQECHFDRRICHTKATQRNGFDKAAIERARLRPILMTIFIFYYHSSLRVGAVGNRSIGMGAVGMLVGTVLGYLYSCVVCNLPRLQERITGTPVATKKMMLHFYEENENKIYRVALLGLTVTVMQSCFIAKDYKRPELKKQLIYIEMK
jgi:hypothetical protein